MALKQKVSQKINDQKRIEFAKQLEYFYESSYADLKKVLIFSFLKGIATGLGVFLGGTIVVTLLLWLLSALGSVPFIDNISDGAKQSIQKGQTGE